MDTDIVYKLRCIAYTAYASLCSVMTVYIYGALCYMYTDLQCPLCTKHTSHLAAALHCGCIRLHIVVALIELY